MKLQRSFYGRPTLDVARDLLGKVLVHRRRDRVTSGAIVEVEAYVGECDPASHAACGRTARNEPMYGRPGQAYVYFNYGIHCLMNVVTEPEEQPAAVLIRALDPVDGIEIMRRRRTRGKKGAKSRLQTDGLCRGPGNLTVAMGITLRENRLDLLGDRLFIEDRGVEMGRIVWGPRIGISTGRRRPWRAWIDGHPSVSCPSARGASR